MASSNETTCHFPKIPQQKYKSKTLFTFDLTCLQCLAFDLLPTESCRALLQQSILDNQRFASTICGICRLCASVTVTVCVTILRFDASLTVAGASLSFCDWYSFHTQWHRCLALLLFLLFATVFLLSMRILLCQYHIIHSVFPCKIHIIIGKAVSFTLVWRPLLYQQCVHT